MRPSSLELCILVLHAHKKSVRRRAASSRKKGTTKKRNPNRITFVIWLKVFFAQTVIGLPYIIARTASFILLFFRVFILPIIQIET